MSCSPKLTALLGACTAFEQLLPSCLQALDAFVQPDACIKDVDRAVYPPLLAFQDIFTCPVHDQWPSSISIAEQAGHNQLWADFESDAFGPEGLLAQLVAKITQHLQQTGDASETRSRLGILDSACVLLTKILRSCRGTWQALNSATTACDKVVTAAAAADLLNNPSAAMQDMVKQLLDTCRVPLAWARVRLARACGEQVDPTTPFDSATHTKLKKLLHAQGENFVRVMQDAGVQPVQLTSAVLQAKLSSDACTRSCFFLWRVLARVALLCPNATLQPGFACNTVLQLWIDAYDVVSLLELLPYPAEGVEGAQVSAQHDGMVDVQWLPICLQAVLQQTARAWIGKALQLEGKHSLAFRHVTICVRQLLCTSTPGAVFCIALSDYRLLYQHKVATGPPTGELGLLAEFVRWLGGACAYADAAAAARSQFAAWLSAAAAAGSADQIAPALQSSALECVLPRCVCVLAPFVKGALLRGTPPSSTQAQPTQEDLRQQQRYIASTAAVLLEQAMGSSAPGGHAAIWGQVCASSPSLYCSALVGHSGLALVGFASQGGSHALVERCAAVLCSVRWNALCAALPSDAKWATRWLQLLDGIAARALSVLDTCSSGKATEKHASCLQIVIAASAAASAFAQLHTESVWRAGHFVTDATLSKMCATLHRAIPAVASTAGTAHLLYTMSFSMLRGAGASGLAPNLRSALQLAKNPEGDQLQDINRAVQALVGQA